ncbi:LarC family nickel insertion protein [Gayadomonas joobiniege]|uniref:LarC family nickel insertion protein n=1 Tax=Gayadomonas joobiniege TaxID=1234606 RepID=UPI0003825BB5|nr:LarC family nickel insertion protein [Gayadomonas joobiniege]
MNLKQINHLHLDVAGGIAGDMFICACIGLQPEFKIKIEALAAQLLPSAAGQLKIFEANSSGIGCYKLSLTSEQPVDSSVRLTQNADKHHHHHSAETSYQALKNRLLALPISSLHCQISLQILTIIATAEAKIHQTDLNHVHFHELADWDSFFDVLAAGYLLSQLAGIKWSVSELPLGGGMVNTQHGLLAVPAPATVEILSGFEFRDDGIKGERITPTGAAILRYLKDADLLIDKKPPLKLLGCGYGGGHKKFPGLPNVLRIMAFSQSQQSQEPDQRHQISQIQFDVDDMTGEELAWALDKLREQAGVLDVTAVTARGKKNRASEQISILLKPSALTAVIDACFNFTSTIGLRWLHLNRSCLSRSEMNLAHGYSIKTVQRPAFAGHEMQNTQKVDSDGLFNCQSLQQRRQLKQQLEAPNEISK